MRVFSIFLLIVSCFSPPVTLHAQTLEGPAIVTIGGNISNPNRDAIDEFDDAFFNSQDIDFDKAYQYDLAGLKKLGFQKFNGTYEDWPATLEFEGPLLKDVLATAGAQGETLVVKALDGYAVDIPIAEIERYPVMLAVKVNGKFLGLGNRGPAWVVYPRDDYPELAKQDDSKYVWSVYYLEVK